MCPRMCGNQEGVVGGLGREDSLDAEIRRDS